MASDLGGIVARDGAMQGRRCSRAGFLLLLTGSGNMENEMKKKERKFDGCIRFNQLNSQGEKR